MSKTKVEKKGNKIITYRNNGTKRVQHITTGKCKVEQNHKESCDINAIVARAMPNDMAPMVRAMNVPGVAKDVSWVTDYHTAYNIVLEGKEAFMSLEPGLRKRFEGDPGKFLDFISREENLEEAREMGIFERLPEEPAPVRVEVTNPTSAAGEE